ncbi:GT-D fold domain-containing glycosyltransferase [Latilactobacillus sakei subsp. sakei]|uniref:GT-D fold domain-containing glycosyltransferase n=1 Tax=Latilactobacillus sakei TaxID=1599 RepID=UPI002865C5C2|nr:GT-D fold domain-containing glycosyltransferase [Latilactobacillus sakei]MDR7925262.1 GT-D fold domain-containing glycosyltransferase [Latilactobacillus sakei subsp. sakei]
MNLSKYKHNRIVKTAVSIIRLLRFPEYLILGSDRKKIKIYAALESIQKIKTSQQTVVRFGDGEFNLMLGKNGISFQEYSEELANDLKLAFNAENILVGIPYGFFDTKGYKWNIKSFWWSYVCRHKKFLNSISGREFIDSTFSRTVTEVTDHSKSDQIINETMDLWNNRNILIIEGSQTRFGVGNNLLSNAKSVQKNYWPPKKMLIQKWKIYIILH